MFAWKQTPQCMHTSSLTHMTSKLTQASSTNLQQRNSRSLAMGLLTPALMLHLPACIKPMVVALPRDNPS